MAISVPNVPMRTWSPGRGIDERAGRVAHPDDPGHHAAAHVEHPAPPRQRLRVARKLLHLGRPPVVEDLKIGLLEVGPEAAGTIDDTGVPATVAAPPRKVACCPAGAERDQGK
jgi:hypothetical protein